jgi:FkbM family methyltransferase
MTIRKIIKRWLYGSCPGFAGAFPYFGCRVYFPPRSMSFLAACEQGIFEADNVRLLTTLAHPGTYLLDVGTNIGLMSLPVLRAIPEIKITSFEASPNVLPYLSRTIAGSPYRTRWNLVPNAVGATVGKVQFSLSAKENSLFDGIKSTQRVETVRQVELEMTTLDNWWESAGRPKISVIKCDVEGGELDVLNGAQKCLRAERPFVLLEWNAQNLAAYGCPSSALLKYALSEGYKLLAVPSLAQIENETNLTLHMVFTESFLLCPGDANQ